jgi:hypothetical protein
VWRGCSLCRRVSGHKSRYRLLVNGLVGTRSAIIPVQHAYARTAYGVQVYVTQSRMSFESACILFVPRELVMTNELQDAQPRVARSRWNIPRRTAKTVAPNNKWQWKPAPPRPRPCTDGYAVRVVRVVRELRLDSMDSVQHDANLSDSSVRFSVVLLKLPFRACSSAGPSRSPSFRVAIANY